MLEQDETNNGLPFFSVNSKSGPAPVDGIFIFTFSPPFNGNPL